MKKMFSCTSNRRIIDSINLRNIRNVYVFSLIACILDALFLALFSAKNWGKPGFWRTFSNVGGCVTACALVVILSHLILRKYKREEKISDTTTNLLMTCFYTVMSVWGIMVDAAHYTAGEQMLTFFIVQFCFVCFVAMRPKIGCILIALSFAALYICTYAADGAAGMQPQNYFIFSIIAVLGNGIQYTTLQASEESKIDILELNQALQQEASVDDLTKLKNRKALRSEYDKHLGKMVYVVMTDIDHFKDYNDTHGHAMGDRVLCQVASATREVFFDADAYRYGGDEFLIILAGCAAEEFEKRTEKWEEALRSIQIENVSAPISCSYGYEYRLLKSQDELRNAIETADNRLYEAKKRADLPPRA